MCSSWPIFLYPIRCNTKFTSRQLWHRVCIHSIDKIPSKLRKFSNCESTRKKSFFDIFWSAQLHTLRAHKHRTAHVKTSTQTVADLHHYNSNARNSLQTRCRFVSANMDISVYVLTRVFDGGRNISGREATPAEGRVEFFISSVHA